jgi:predicted MFS family arabinose efflux permease
MFGFSKFTLISTSSIFYSLLGLIFSLGFLLKSGAAPFHTYKITIYKGLPILSIVNYTFMFYTTYIVYFSYIIPTLVHTTGLVSGLFILFTIVVGTVTLLTSMFSNKHLKTFLALSSSLNVISVLLILISIQ